MESTINEVHLRSIPLSTLGSAVRPTRFHKTSLTTTSYHLSSDRTSVQTRTGVS